MARKEQDYDVTLKGLSEIRKLLETMRQNAKKLDKEAQTAESVLKDRVGKKDILAIKNVAETIKKAVNPGEERILELERKVRTEKMRFEHLER